MATGCTYKLIIKFYLHVRHHHQMQRYFLSVFPGTDSAYMNLLECLKWLWIKQNCRTHLLSFNQCNLWNVSNGSVITESLVTLTRGYLVLLWRNKWILATTWSHSILHCCPLSTDISEITAQKLHVCVHIRSLCDVYFTLHEFPCAESRSVYQVEHFGDPSSHMKLSLWVCTWFLLAGKGWWE